MNSMIHSTRMYLASPSLLTFAVGLCAALPAMEVTRYEEPRGSGESGWIGGQAYASLQENRLVRAVGVGNGLAVRYSDDNGATWSDSQLISAIEQLDDERTRQPDFDTFYLDPDNGVLTLFFAEYVRRNPAKTNKTELELAITDPRSRRMYYQISKDAGRSWGPRQQVIEQGKEYSPEHWARDIWFGKSELVLEGRRILKLSDGTLLAPCYEWPALEQRRRFMREMGALTGFQFEDGREALPDENWHMITVCLRGKWRDDLSAIDWESGGRLLIPYGYASAGTCGAGEPTLAALDDERIFCVVRTGTGLVPQFQERNLAMHRYCATSRDGGRTWEDVRPLRFSDGGELYSPCAYSEFVRSSKNGKWYWIGNILSKPTYGNNDPRYPLQIAELDPKVLGIKRDTVTVIQDRPADEPPLVRYSNFRIYEERITHDFILFLTQDYSELEKNPVKRPTYRYRIKVP